MKCMHCKGTMERGVAPFHIDRKGYHLTLDEIPAWICAQCKEVFFEDKEVESIQFILRSIDEQTEKLANVA